MTMTEIEARGKIKYRIANEMRKAGENKEEYEDLEIALQVMKEIREYRELGTVEKCRDNNDFLDFLYNHIPPNEMEQYLYMYHTKDKVAVNGYADQSSLMSAT